MDSSGSSSTEPYCRCCACAARGNNSTNKLQAARCTQQTGSRPPTTQPARQRCATAPTACSIPSSSTVCTAALPLQGAWLCVTGASGQPLDHWDLHVGAELSLLGRKVVLKRVSG